jgi:hypothetical protein
MTEAYKFKDEGKKRVEKYIRRPDSDSDVYSR